MANISLKYLIDRKKLIDEHLISHGNISQTYKMSILSEKLSKHLVIMCKISLHHELFTFEFSRDNTRLKMPLSSIQLPKGNRLPNLRHTTIISILNIASNRLLKIKLCTLPVNTSH